MWEWLRRPRVIVRDTGKATADSGGVAVTGAVFGDISINVITPPVRSAYLEQVRRIAPDSLTGRDGDLADLAAFCTADGPAYLRLTGDAWAGKSALMSWFVLHPPPGVRVLSFFLTARFAGQSDRRAFTDVLLEQLADLLDRPIPAFLTDATREVHLLAMLRDAVDVHTEQRQRLVLVVDGLDEDRGVTPEADSYSVAALLPSHPPPALRIIVTSRPDPPLPDDLPEDHPLRDPAVTRTLAPSPEAQVIREDALRELRRLIHGTERERDLLALVASAGGGLSGRDLAELMGVPAVDVLDQLNTASGRTFTRRPTRRFVDVYLLAHEELQAEALTRLGDERLITCRSRLHRWAEGYASLGWPDDTPEYLFTTYFRMLSDTGDQQRLIHLAGDQQRQDRMLTALGSDAAALAEIRSALQAALAAAEPDLTRMAQLALRRGELVRRNVALPGSLAVAWAELGDLDRAQAMGIALRADEALAQVAAEAARQGQLGRAGDICRDIATPHHLATALSAIAAACDRGSPAIGEAVEQITRIADQVTDGHDRAVIQTALAVATDAHGEQERARTLLNTACHTAGAVEDALLREAALRTVAAAGAAIGDLDQAMNAAHSMRFLAEEALVTLVRPLITAGRTPTAQAIVDRTIGVGARILGAAALAHGLAEGGRPEQAALALDDAETRARAFAERGAAELATPFLIAVAEAATTVDHDRAAVLLDIAEQTARRADTARHRAEALVVVARSIGHLGDRDRAGTLLRDAETATRTESSAMDLGTLSSLATAVAVIDFDRAVELARRPTGPYDRLQVLNSILAVAGPDDAGRDRLIEHVALAQAETSGTNVADYAAGLAARIALRLDVPDAVTRAIDAATQTARDGIVTDLAVLAAELGRVDQARRFLDQIDAPMYRGKALGALVTATGPGEQATALADELVRLAETGAGSWPTLLALPAVDALTDAGDLARALSFAESLGYPPDRDKALRVVARATAIHGDIKAAISLIERIDDPQERMTALAELVGPAAAAGEWSLAVQLATGEAVPAWLKAHALADLVEILADAGNEELAGSITAAIGDDIPWQRAMRARIRHSGSLQQSRRLIAELLTQAPVTVGLSLLGATEPAALLSLLPD
ncbi:P-loop domain-containing protein [Micromonospora rifamycinica]|uniref:NACHT domain-containing protein n=1 Tax=Micromonospora rifamycinica TaxID=291594 RepID=UPI00155FA7BA|nr:NACHT domain-containing protein [Micromonospora rifamycinica]